MGNPFLAGSCFSRSHGDRRGCQCRQHVANRSPWLRAVRKKASRRRQATYAATAARCRKRGRFARLRIAAWRRRSSRPDAVRPIELRQGCSVEPTNRYRGTKQPVDPTTTVQFVIVPWQVLSEPLSSHAQQTGEQQQAGSRLRNEDRYVVNPDVVKSVGEEETRYSTCDSKLVHTG